MTIAQTVPVRRRRLIRSVAFWILLFASLASLAVGILLTVPNIGVMSAALLDGTATGVEVYAGQAWVTLGAALAGAGVLGLLLALALAAAASLVPHPASGEPVQPSVDEVAEDEPARDEVPAGATA